MAPIAAVERQELEAAVAGYRVRVGRELPRCGIWWGAALGRR